MGLRVKNVAAGYTDAHGFHPIRRSPDYDPDRADESFNDRTAGKGLKYKRKAKGKKAAPKRKKVAKKAAPKQKKATAKITPEQWEKIRGSKFFDAKTRKKYDKQAKAVKAKRKKNPLRGTKGMVPAKWTPAKVRRTPGGDIQVMFVRGKQ